MTPRRAAVLAVALAVLWLFVQPVEGPVLLRLSATHGVTAADLLSVALLAGGVLLWRRG